MAGYRVLVCGGRNYMDSDHIFNTLFSLDAARRITVIIHGAATGADMQGMIWAQENGRRHLPMPADWSEHGKAAGPIRNQRMLEEGHPDVVVAFPGGKGTADMRRRAKAAGVEIIDVPARVPTP